jgi:hypothetical protein
MIDMIKNAMHPMIRQFGMRAIREDGDPQCPIVVFANDSIELEVRVEWRELRPYLLLSERLAVPRSAGATLSKRAGRAFDVDDLLLLRAKGKPTPAGKMIGEGGNEAAAALLREYSEALRAYATDVLTGDFQVFNELDAVVAERRHKLMGGG